MYDIVIKNGWMIDVTSKKCNAVKKDIVIKGNVIEKIEENTKENAKKVIDADGCVVMPGFVNCHSHVAMSIFRGYSDDTALDVWLVNKIFPVEDRLEAKDIYYGSMLSCIEMIKSGTTTFNDMYFFMEEVARAVSDTKIRAMLGRGIMSVTDDNDIRIKEAIDLYNKYNNKENNRIRVSIAPHALNTCNRKAIEKSMELCEKYNVPLHIHLDETKDEHEKILKEYKMTPTKLLDKIGVLDKCHVILAHGVWLDDEDIEILKKIKGGVVHNPISNCKLASGLAKITKMLNSNICVSLGTDGAGSTNTLDMFEEMKVCNYLQKLFSLDPTAINASEVLKMATINGAKTLGLEKKIGSIEIGKKADIIIVNMNNEHLSPVNDIISNLVYSCNAADVLTTIVDGNILMENRKLNGIDEDYIIDESKKISNKYF